MDITAVMSIFIININFYFHGNTYRLLFNSISFAFFLPIVFLLYWFVAHRKLSHQNILLLIASYVFYSYWDWRFSFLLLFSTLLDFFSGIRISKSQTRAQKKAWLFISIIINIGLLAVCKYFNFFIDSFSEFVSAFGFHPNLWTLNIVLPIGISFYTFHGVSYIIDIYKERVPVEKNVINYALFVSFFPLLVAGPIERATHLLPQIQKERIFSYHQAVLGLKQIVWGLFKKIVIADACAIHADAVFSNYEIYPSSTLVLGAVFFSFQIYCDFSGYSDIAIGMAKLFGIDLLRNFSYPYFSRDIAEFWRRWHISLTTWFRDYLYIPLGGSKGNTWTRVRNTFIIFLVSGLWHGANWTFVAWGFLNALYFLPLLLLNKHRSNLDIVAQGRSFPSLKEFMQMLLTFILVTLAWIFFRSENIHHASGYFSRLISSSLFAFPLIPNFKAVVTTITLIIFFIIIEWTGRGYAVPLAAIGTNWKKPVRWTFYMFIVFMLGMFMQTTETPFIYFQF